jgi:hypothetical protein
LLRFEKPQHLVVYAINPLYFGGQKIPKSQNGHSAAIVSQAITFADAFMPASLPKPRRYAPVGGLLPLDILVFILQSPYRQQWLASHCWQTKTPPARFGLWKSTKTGGVKRQI